MRGEDEGKRARAGGGGGERNDSVTHAIAHIVMSLRCPHEPRMWARGARVRVSEGVGDGDSDGEGERREVPRLSDSDDQKHQGKGFRNESALTQK